MCPVLPLLMRGVFTNGVFHPDEGTRIKKGGSKMSLVRFDPFRKMAQWEPLRDLEEMSERMNHLLSRVGLVGDGGKEALTTVDWTPSVDISETEKEYIIKAELPEVKKEEVKVAVQEGVLTIQGERKQEKEEKNKKFHRIERSYGAFLRSFTIPDDADETKVSAEFKEGILIVHLAKSEKAKPKSIEVKVA